MKGVKTPTEAETSVEDHNRLTARRKRHI